MTIITTHKRVKYGVKLKDKCPECGQNTLRRHFQQNNRGEGGAFVRCSNCGASKGAV